MYASAAKPRARTLSATCRTSSEAPKHRASSRPYASAASAASPKSVATRIRLSVTMMNPLLQPNGRVGRVCGLKKPYVVATFERCGIGTACEADASPHGPQRVEAVRRAPALEFANDRPQAAR